MAREKAAKMAFFATIFISCIVAEAIGPIIIPMGKLSVGILPMVVCMFIVFLLYVCKPIKVVNGKYDSVAKSFIMYGITLYIASTGINIGANIDTLVHAGPALLLQEIGNLGVIIFAFPAALLLGFKRESIGLSSSIAKDQGVAIIAAQYGLDGPEGRGVMMTYIVGAFIGVISMNFFIPLLDSLEIFHPYALAMSCGVGSGSMMAAGASALIQSHPEMEAEITAYASVSNTLSGLDLTYLTIFVTLPLLEFLYKKLEPVAAKIRREKCDYREV